MTDRDRLIELFNKVDRNPQITCPAYNTDKTCKNCKYTINESMCNHIERKVDYLLANGVVVLDMSVIAPKNRPLITHIAERPLNDVLELLRAEQEGRLIVPPCKVADVVYGFHHKNILPYVVKWFETDDYGNWRLAAIYPPMAPRFYSFTDFGKTVFLSKEEAEAKLKERQKNENSCF